MEYQALYRRWRPLTFDEVVGQEHVTRTIKNEVASGNVGHAFLFCGSRGTGKTTTARILARAVNCLSPKDGNPCNECASCKGILNGSIMDVYEIDAASNSGVDNIRSLREEANYAAAAVKYKVYIIDEVHALSKDAFNALLKLLEEPPAHVKFILATTEAHKVLDTISSRCQRFDFRKIKKSDMVKRLEEICDAEMIEIAPEAVDAIAEAADGSLRDALTVLEPCISEGKSVDTLYVKELLGLASRGAAARLCLAIAKNDAKAALEVLDDVCSSGKNLAPFTEEVIKAMRDIMIYAVTRKKPPSVGEADWEPLSAAAELISADKAVYAVNCLSEAYSKSKYISAPRFLIEAAAVRLCDMKGESSIEALEARVGELEKKIALGARIPPPAPEKPSDEPARKPREEKTEKIAEKPRSEASPAASDIGRSVEKIKEKWPEIMSKLVSGGQMNMYLALSNSSLRSYGDKVAIVFSNSGGATFRDMVDGKADEIASVIREETGLDVKLTFKLEGDFEETEKAPYDPFDEIASNPFVKTEE